jgi:hypothetical protein
MQAINRIQNANINADAGFQAGMVVDSANAHRAIPFYRPCESKPVSKCSGQMPMSLRTKMIERMQTRLRLTPKGSRHLTSGLKPGKWRNDNRHNQMPAMVWATFVLSPTTTG